MDGFLRVLMYYVLICLNSTLLRISFSKKVVMFEMIRVDWLHTHSNESIEFNSELIEPC